MRIYTAYIQDLILRHSLRLLHIHLHEDRTQQTLYNFQTGGRILLAQQDQHMLGQQLYRSQHKIQKEGNRDQDWDRNFRLNLSTKGQYQVRIIARSHTNNSRHRLQDHNFRSYCYLRNQDQ